MSIEQAMRDANRPRVRDIEADTPGAVTVHGERLYASGADTAARRELTLAELGRRMFELRP